MSDKLASVLATALLATLNAQNYRSPCCVGVPGFRKNSGTIQAAYPFSSPDTPYSSPCFGLNATPANPSPLPTVRG